MEPDLRQEGREGGVGEGCVLQQEAGPGTRGNISTAQLRTLLPRGTYIMAAAVSLQEKLQSTSF